QGKVAEHLPAIRWLIDAISEAKGAADHRIFRIENLDLLDALGLPRRPQNWRYSLDEIRQKKVETEGAEKGMLEGLHQIKLAQNTPEEERTLYHEKVFELARKLSIYSNVVSSFEPLRLPDSDNADEIRASLRELEIRVANVNASGSPRVVPPM